jgi:hypothetical protein
MSAKKALFQTDVPVDAFTSCTCMTQLSSPFGSEGAAVPENPGWTSNEAWDFASLCGSKVSDSGASGADYLRP